jgi:hypothetical protein
VEGSCRGLLQGTIQAFAGGTEENDEKPQLVSRAVPNTSQKRYSLSQIYPATVNPITLQTAKSETRKYSLQLGYTEKYFKYILYKLIISKPFAKFLYDEPFSIKAIQLDLRFM